MTASSLSNVHATPAGTSAVSAERLFSLKAQIDRLRNQLAQAPTESGFKSATEDFLDFLRTYDDAVTFKAFERSADFAQYQDFFSACILRFAWEMEGLSFNELMSATFGPKQKVGQIMGPHTWGAYARIGDLLRLVDFSACKKYLMLGCGRVPSSLFYLHDWTDVPHLVGIDNDALSVDMARQLVDALGLGDRIRIESGDAIEFDYSDFDVIYWGPFAKPRMQVMQRIASSAKTGSTVILREPWFTGSLATESVLASLGPRFTVRGQSDSFPGRFMLKHYILDLR